MRASAACLACLALTAAACSRDQRPNDAAPSASATTSARPSASARPGAGAVPSPSLVLGATAKHACMLERAGTLRCWGNDDRGQLGDTASLRPRRKPSLVPDLPPVALAALGARHTCVLLRDGAVRCWGDNDDDQLGAAGAAGDKGRVSVAGLSQVTQLVAGHAFTCALDAAHQVFCWGRLPGGDGTTPSPQRIPDLEASRLAAAGGSMCALRTSGAVACWGANWESRILPGGPPRVERPTDVDKLGKAIDVAMSDLSTCVVLEGGKAQCWGGHFSQSSPENAYDVDDVDAITGGASGHFCAHTRAGGIKCWGERSTGAVGEGRGYSTIEIDGFFSEVRAGADFTCARASSGSVTCWGTDDRGQLAQSFEDAVPGPKQVCEGARSIAVGAEATCAVLTSGKVRCWGPDPTGKSNPDPREITAVIQADTLTMGGGIACAFTADLPTCWGDNGASQLPSQNPGLIEEPMTLASLKGKKALAFGPEHACALSSDGSVECWGGLGKERATPTQVRGISGAAAIALGADEGCALLGDGGVACWPLREPSPAAGGSAAPRFASARVKGVRGATSLAHGKAHACVTDAHGGVTCWGKGDDGRLGREGAGAMDPAPLDGIDGAVELALGDDFSCARRRDGTAACWGNDTSAQLGDGKETNRAAPRPVEGLTSTTMLRAGARHTCALNKKGEVLCWGDNRRRAIQQGSPLVSKKALPVFGLEEPSDAGKP